MKMIVAIVQPTSLEPVKKALHDIDITGLTVTDARGAGKQKGIVGEYRGAEYVVNLLPKTRIEVVLPEARVEQAIEAITGAARSGKIGDGKIFVLPIEKAVRIRTGETDEAAIQ